MALCERPLLKLRPSPSYTFAVLKILIAYSVDNLIITISAGALSGTREIRLMRASKPVGFGLWVDLRDLNPYDNLASPNRP